LAALLRAPQTRNCAEVVATLGEWTDVAASEHERLLALDALAGAGDPRAVALLHEAAASASAATRLRAVLAARTATGQDNLLRAAQLAVLARAGGDVAPAIRRAAVEALGGWGEQGTPLLIAALGDADDDVRRQACLALPRPATDRIVALVKDGDPLQRQSAAFILVRAGEHGARAHLLAVVAELAERAYAIAALAEPLRAWQTPAARALQATLAERLRQAARQVVWLLGALSGEQAIQGTALGLLSENPITRSNAGEALEALTSPRLARWLAPLLRGDPEGSGSARSPGADASRDLLMSLWPRLRGAAAPIAVSAPALLDADGWLTALTIIAATELEASACTNDELRPALESALNDPRVIVRNAARVALDRGEAATADERRDATMLSAIEKAIFLKSVPLFDAMPIDQIRALVGISEEASYAEQQAIFSEAEPGDCLFVVVSGRVAVQQRAGRRRDSIVRLATLGPREYFGENALFDAAPRDADAVALEPTQTLTVRRGPFVEVIRQYPHLALDLLGVFSQRLREANSTIAAKTAARPKELVSLYDKF
jgi:CRP-like cAMP-binding protein